MNAIPKNMKNRLPKVVVGMAVYNGGNFLEEQITSIMTQEGVDVSLYISLDKSSDDSESVIQRIMKQFGSIYFLSSSERFGSAGLNFYNIVKKLNIDEFDYFAFADQDDIWKVNKLERACSTLRTNSLDGYSSGFIAFWDNGVERRIIKPTMQKEFDYFFESAGPGCTYVISNSLFKAFQEFVKDHFEQIKSVDYHDWLCYAFARSKRFSWYIDEWPSIYYRQHSSNQLGVNHGISAVSKRFLKILNGYGIRQSLLIIKCLDHNFFDYVVNSNESNSSINCLKLALMFRKCRRGSLDQLFFVISCILMMIIRPSLKK